MFSKLVSTVVFFQLFNCASSFAASSYSPDFLWGAAFSAHQTEGKVGGGENGDWYQFEHPWLWPSPITNHDTADLAVDHWNRYEEDLQAAKSVGLNTLRTSIAWEKIEPQQGMFNSDAMAHYRAEFKRMNALGIRPMICLHHFTHPTWFNDMGGWDNDQSPQLFLQYAKYVVDNLKDVTNLWITFNEPMILVQMGYLKGEVPPKKIGLDSALGAAYNLARAHRIVTNYIHQVQGLPSNGTLGHHEQGVSGVGIAYSFSFFDPADPNNKNDVAATENLMELSNWDWLRGAETGHVEFRLKVPDHSDQVYTKDIPASDLPENPGPVYDWIGVNYYQRYLIQSKPDSLVPFAWITPQGPTGDNGWSIYPQGLERLLKEIDKRFSYPLVVTENGMADGNDSKRPQFIRDHLHFLDNAILGKTGKPLDIRGYYHWSLMDNFEWLSGYSYKFGLYEVQFNNDLKRVPRESARVYSNEIKARMTN